MSGLVRIFVLFVLVDGAIALAGRGMIAVTDRVQHEADSAVLRYQAQLDCVSSPTCDWDAMLAKEAQRP